MDNIYDVAIVGAGPAGATFARELAKGDPSLRLLLIDGQVGGHGKVCGGLLSPDVQKVFARLGLTLPRSVLSEHQIFAVETVDLSSKYARCYQRHYLNMDRQRFDKWLLSLVPEGVEVIVGRCVSIERIEGNYRLSVRKDGNTTEFLARSIVGADGADSIVRRTFFDSKMFHYVAIQQWFVCNTHKLPPYSCIFDPKTSDSCSWTILKDDCVVFGGAFAAHGCRRAFEEQRSRFEDYIGHKLGEPTLTEACLLSSPRRARDFIVGERGAYLVGEAAGFISSSSFEGISSALLSGKLLADAYLKGKEHPRILSLYRASTRKLRLKLYFKIPKMRILCSPMLRKMIMKSGIASVKKYDSSVK